MAEIHGPQLISATAVKQHTAVQDQYTGVARQQWAHTTSSSGRCSTCSCHLPSLSRYAETGNRLATTSRRWEPSLSSWGRDRSCCSSTTCASLYKAVPLWLFRRRCSSNRSAGPHCQCCRVVTSKLAAVYSKSNAHLPTRDVGSWLASGTEPCRRAGELERLPGALVGAVPDGTSSPTDALVASGLVSSSMAARG